MSNPIEKARVAIIQRDAYLKSKRPVDGSNPRWWDVEISFLETITNFYNHVEETLIQRLEALESETLFLRQQMATAEIKQRHEPLPPPVEPAYSVKNRAYKILKDCNDRLFKLYDEPWIAVAIYGTENFENVPDYEARREDILYRKDDDLCR